MRYKQYARLALLCAILVAGACAGQAARADPAKAAQEGSGETLEVFFFDCGKADSMLIRQGEHAMLIDAATDREGPYVLSRLREEGISRLDALLLTHEDKDHVGGADLVLRALGVERVYKREIVEGGNKQTSQFAEALRQKGIRAAPLAAGDTFSLGLAQVTVLGPVGDGGGKRSANDDSIVVRVDFGETRFLFTADATNKAIKDLLAAPGAPQNLRAQVLKVPQHGGKLKRSADLYEAVRPQIAVIPCERGTQDGLPHADTVRELEKAGADIYVTGDGEVKVVSDGIRLAVSVSPPRY